MVEEQLFCKDCEYFPDRLQEDYYPMDHCNYVKGSKSKITPVTSFETAKYAYPGMDNLHNKCPYFKQRKKPFKPQSKFMKILRLLFF